MPEHGGAVLVAAKKFDIPPNQWLDLSTGISPFSWSAPLIPQNIWHHLPQEDDGLLEVARQYYGNKSIIACPGSQSAIQAIAWLRSPCKVIIGSPTYNEHPHAWIEAGHQVKLVDIAELDDNINKADVVVICNPNNPTGTCVATEQLINWNKQLTKRGGWLIVDEAFIDVKPELSVAQYVGGDGLIVLRSLGKFFGLAGARVGFVLAWTKLLDQLSAKLGPWCVTGPSRWIAKQALADTQWHFQARKFLFEGSLKLSNLLVEQGLVPTGSTEFFKWIVTDNAPYIYDRLCHQGILTRLFQEPLSLRVGLPDSEQSWSRLSNALTSINNASFISH